ncbi:RNA-binding protein, putative [Babesia caballi]|uniref:RNA-binding protein, putative n=1 Tax=Babesia caballi TaxID=5871 RepID=A0AAV4LX06_BABCB|nr:RNA-binding protein, putative [Babesia caballi]
MELRLCDFLKEHAPHIFERQQTNTPGPYALQRVTGSRSQPRGPYEYSTTTESAEFVTPRDLPQEQRQYVAADPSQRSPPEHRTPGTVKTWNGKLLRNGKKPVEAVANAISGRFEIALNKVRFHRTRSTVRRTSTPSTSPIDSSGKTPQRARPSQVSPSYRPKSQRFSVFQLKGQQATKAEAFDEYIKYFQSKERVGVATIDKDLSIYVCAPGTQLYETYAPKQDAEPMLIGIAVATSSSPTATQAENADKAEPQLPEGKDR